MLEDTAFQQQGDNMVTNDRRPLDFEHVYPTTDISGESIKSPSLFAKANRDEGKSNSRIAL